MTSNVTVTVVSNQHCNFNVRVILRFRVLFTCLPLCACQSDTNGSILYDHAKYVILLVEVEIVFNSGCNLKLLRRQF